MAKNTKIVADELEQHVDVVRYDISPGSLVRGAQYHGHKGRLVVKGLLGLLMNKRIRSLYIPSDAGWGMVYTALFLLVARVRALSVFVHHRSFAYIDRPALLMRLIVLAGGKNARHIFLCGGMKARFSAIYGTGFEGRVVSNAQHVNPILDDEIKKRGSEFVIGHLSNLSAEKGLFEVLGVFDRLKAGGIKCRLILAGPAASVDAKEAIDSAMERHPGLIESRGSVWGADKDRFYRDIDVFLFPTKYKNEAQPNVVFEALSYAVPVVAYARGCVREDLNVGGMVVGEQDDYVSAAHDFILECHGDHEGFSRLRSEALAAVREARANAIAGYQDFIQAVVNSVGTPS